MSEPQEGWDLDPDRVVVRDKRRLDESGRVRRPEEGATGSSGSSGSSSAEPDAQPSGPSAGVPTGATDPQPPAGQDGATAESLSAEEDRLAAELTADLQRVSAEYANYRKRVERDRVAVVEMATAGLLSQLLPVLDDVERAREHGDLTGAFAAVGEALQQVTAKLGLEQFGEAGEPFDPSVHEALMAAEPDPAVSVPTCAAVFQKGYRLSGGRVLRPARVSVAEPAAPAASDS